MNRKHINRLNMYNAVDTVFTNYGAAYQGKEAMQDAIARFRNNKSDIENIARGLSVKTTGATTDKNNAKFDLINSLYIASGQGVAYAAKINNQDLRVKLKFAKMQLNNESDEEIEKRAANNIQLLKEQLPNMSGYDLSETEMNELEQKLSNFRKSIGTKTTVKTSSSVQLKSMSELIYSIQNILRDELDFLMKKYIAANPDFYKAYRIARKVSDLGGSKGNNPEPAPAVTK